MKELNSLISQVGQKAIKTAEPKKEPIQGDAFEVKLQETVAKLENMGNEIDAMIKGEGAKSTQEVSQGVNQVGNMIQSMQGLVEDIAAPKQTAGKSPKFVANQYQKNQIKDS